MTINTVTVLSIGADLLSDAGAENAEYDRAIVELTAGLLGITEDNHRDALPTILRAIKNGTNNA